MIRKGTPAAQGGGNKQIKARVNFRTPACLTSHRVNNCSTAQCDYIKLDVSCHILKLGYPYSTWDYLTQIKQMLILKMVLILQCISIVLPLVPECTSLCLHDYSVTREEGVRHIGKSPTQNS